MDRTEWPTKSHLDDLREQGIVVQSPFSLRCVAALAVMVGGLIVWRLQTPAWTKIKDWLSEPNRDLLSSLQGTLELLMRSLIWPAVLTVVAVFFAGLLQTKFMLRVSNLGLDLRRLNFVRLPSINIFARRILGASLVLFVVLGLWVGVALIMAPEILKLLVLPSPECWGHLRVLAVKGLGLVGSLLVATALLSWIVARWQFMIHNRMTRAEVEAETREQV